MKYAQIMSTGRYVPEKVLPNRYFDELFPERDIDGWLRKNVGIEQRHVMAEDETTSDLSLHAARQALARAQLEPDALDLIIVATDTPDYISPATATVLQAKLGAENAGTFDINTACAGWVTALDTAARYLMTDPALNHILVVGAYGMSRFVDYTDHKTCTLFADGAGAPVISLFDLKISDAYLKNGSIEVSSRPLILDPCLFQIVVRLVESASIVLLDARSCEVRKWFGTALNQSIPIWFLCVLFDQLGESARKAGASDDRVRADGARLLECGDVHMGPKAEYGSPARRRR